MVCKFLEVVNLSIESDSLCQYALMHIYFASVAGILCILTVLYYSVNGRSQDGYLFTLFLAVCCIGPEALLVLLGVFIYTSRPIYTASVYPILPVPAPADYRSQHQSVPTAVQITEVYERLEPPVISSKLTSHLRSDSIFCKII